MKQNRSLDDIASEIHTLERKSIFDIGALLLKAKAQCEHGEWLPWLASEFEWSEDTAERYLGAARLAAKFRTVRNLNVTVRTIYQLATFDEADWPDAVKALAKAAHNKRLTEEDGRRIIHLVRLRRTYGDLPEATLRAIQKVEAMPCFGTDWPQKAIAALKKGKPETEEEASKIIEANHPFMKGGDTGSDDDVTPDDDDTASDDDDDAPEDDDGRPSPANNTQVDPELKAALQIVLRHTGAHCGDKIDAVALQIIGEFVIGLANSMRGHDAVKSAADRAEATRARRLHS